MREREREREREERERERERELIGKTNEFKGRNADNRRSI